MGLMKEMKHLLGKKVVGIDQDTLFFEDGTCINFHEYETYVGKFTKESYKRNNKYDKPHFYSPKFWEEEK